MSACLDELRECGSSLRNFSEQNWNVAEQLSDMFGQEYDGAGDAFVREKTLVAEIEEAVVGRIEKVLEMAVAHNEIIGSPGANTDQNETRKVSYNAASNNSEGTNKSSNTQILHIFDHQYFVSMSDVCSRLKLEKSRETPSVKLTTGKDNAAAELSSPHLEELITSPAPLASAVKTQEQEDLTTEKRSSIKLNTPNNKGGKGSQKRQSEANVGERNKRLCLIDDEKMTADKLNSVDDAAAALADLASNLVSRRLSPDF